MKQNQTSLTMSTNSTQPSRIVIYSKDVEILTGKSAKSSRDMLTRLRKALGRRPRDPLTYRDFCKFYSWDEDLVKENLRISYGLLLFVGFYFWILRDDLDIAAIYIVNWVMFKLWWKEIKGQLKSIKNLSHSKYRK